MRTRTKQAVLCIAGVTFASLAATADQWRCPVVTAASETTSRIGGVTIHNVGQVAIGLTWGGGVNLHAGVIPCYTNSGGIGFLAGDMNCDGVLSVGDIAGFVLALTNPAQYAIEYPDCNVMNADVNGDTVVSVGDIGAFVALLTGG